jgi:NADH:ubiquinone oxidoreductase subunit 5 (subunit L)/multisubunit Na+/H+ antiporter MnhA subunit
MEAPTPASALIHSSTLVIMGVFLIIRFNVLFEFSLISNYILAILGAVTIAFGAITAIFQNDIKKLIAYSTISQIGYLICGCGFGAYDEVLLYLIMHAFNKAFLFILAGFVVHYFSGNTDMRQMGGLFLYTLDITAYILAITINLAGLPYSAGFYAKEFLIFQILKDDYISIIVQVSWLLSFIFTPLYMLILLFFVFFDFKKSNIKNYKSTWSIRPNLNLTLKTINFNIFSKYQITLLTSRLVIYILLAVYLVYSSLGDYLVSLIFNYSLNFDNTTNLFFNIKNKQTYLLYSFSYYTLLSLTYIIFTSVTFSYLFLEKLQINQTYIQINQLTYTVNLLFILIVLLLAYYNIYFIMLLGLLF